MYNESTYRKSTKQVCQHNWKNCSVSDLSPTNNFKYLTEGVSLGSEKQIFYHCSLGSDWILRFYENNVIDNVYFHKAKEF